MLYHKIRHAGKIRKIYRLQNILTCRKRPEIGSRLGFSKYSKQYYDFMKSLKEQKILDRNGLFIGKPTNIWIAKLPLVIKGEEVTHVLGYENPYSIYVALVINKVMTVREIVKDLQIKERTAFDSLAKLANVDLIIKKGGKIFVNEENAVFVWFEKYLGVCIRESDSIGEISPLFDCVPAYVDGLHAYYILNYEPGRPAGPSNMTIRTYRPYKLFWNIVTEQIGYYRQFPKKIRIKDAVKGDEIVYREKIPYNKNAKWDDLR